MSTKMVHRVIKWGKRVPLYPSQDSPNVGRTFFVCGNNKFEACNFFCWEDEISARSQMRRTFEEGSKRLYDGYGSQNPTEAMQKLTPDDQFNSWANTKQGSEAWHALRSWRITASNFGAAHGNEGFSTPKELLRQLLWPVRQVCVCVHFV